MSVKMTFYFSMFIFVSTENSQQCILIMQLCLNPDESPLVNKIVCNSLIEKFSYKKTNPFKIEEKANGTLVLLEFLDTNDLLNEVNLEDKMCRVYWMRKLDTYDYVPYIPPFNSQGRTMTLFFIHFDFNFFDPHLGFNPSRTLCTKVFARMNCSDVISLVSFKVVQSISTFSPEDEENLNTIIFHVRTTRHTNDSVSLETHKLDLPVSFFSIIQRTLV